MKFRFCFFGLLLAAVAQAQDENAPGAPSWQDEIARGYLPHRQLKVEDFPINDKTDPSSAFALKSFIHPRPHYLVRPGDGVVEVAIDQLLIFSGLDRSATWRKSSFKEMAAALPYAQALLDLNEIYARQLAAEPVSSLPQVRNTNGADATTELDGVLKELVNAQLKLVQAETEALSKATDGGHNAKKVREKAAEIRTRLKATPATTVPYSEK